jgi:hypothetical protein
LSQSLEGFARAESFEFFQRYTQKTRNRQFFFFAFFLLKNQYLILFFIFYIFKSTTLQQENYDHSFNMAEFFDAVPVRPGISLGVGPLK